MKKLVSLAMSVVMPLSMFMTSQINAIAVGENIPGSAQQSVEKMDEFRKEAIADYEKYANTKCVYEGEERPVFRMLLIEGRNLVSQTGKEFSSTEEDDLIFSKVPEQLENLVEYLTDYRVDMVVDTLAEDDVITLTSDYPRFEDVTPTMEKYVPYGKYDSVLTLIPEHIDSGNPCTSLGTGDSFSGCGYSWCPIARSDHDKSVHENENWHYYTTDLILHEWIHQLEVFRDIAVGDGNIIMPSADIAGLYDGVTLSEDGTKFTNGVYEWDNIWPEDTVHGHSKEYYIGGDIKSISYSRAVLSGTLYDIKNKRYIGMFPAFWKFYNGNLMLGEFYGSNDEGYKSFGESSQDVLMTEYPEYKNDSFIWRLYYSIKNGDVGVVNKNIARWYYNSSLADHADVEFTKISFNSEGDYYIMNSSSQKYLSADTENKSLTFSDFTDDDSIKWTISYLGDNFVRIASKSDPDLIFDINNAWDIDEGIVQLHAPTPYESAQSFQLRLNLDDTYTIYPLLSVKRCLTEKAGAVVIDTDSKNAEQKWKIVKADGTPIPVVPPVTTTAVVTAPVPTTTQAVPTTEKAVPTTAKAVPTTAKAVPTTTKAVPTAAAPTTVPTTAVTVKLRGDANLDSRVNVADAVAVLQFVSAKTKYPLDEQGIVNADIDGEKGLTGTDAVMIQKIDAGIE